MSTTHFIIISGKPQTDVIARQIVNECVPHSCEVLVSAGYVGNDDDCYSFDLNGESYHFDNLEGGFCNHIAQFIKAAGLSAQTSQVNLFFLDNPYGERDLDLSAYVKLIDTIQNPTHGFNCVNILHVVLGYDTHAPHNVMACPSEEAMQNIFKINKKAHINTLYIGSQYLNGGATFTNTKHHAFHLPRMLADFMLVASAPQSSTGIDTAAAPADSQTKVFSFGHAECMYMASDIQELLGLYLKKELIEIKLNGFPQLTCSDSIGKKNSLEKLMDQHSSEGNYSKPAGNRVHITLIDELINSHFCSFFGEEPYFGTNCCTYDDVYNASTTYDNIRYAHGEETEEKHKDFQTKKNIYESIKNKVASSDFKNHITSSIDRLQNGIDEKNKKKGELEDEIKNRSFFKRILEFINGASRRRNNRVSELLDEIEKFKLKIRENEKALSAHNSVLKHNNEHLVFLKLLNEVQSLEKDKRDIEYKIEQFQLAEYDGAIPLIDLSKAKAYFSKNKAVYRNKIIEEYKSSVESGKDNLDSVFDRIVACEKEKYETIDGRTPFEFIKFGGDNNYNLLDKTYGTLWDKSLPCFRAENSDGGKSISKITTFIYANHESYILQNITEIPGPYTIQHSPYLKDKICMLKIVPLSSKDVYKLTGKTQTEEVEEVIDGYATFEGTSTLKIPQNQTMPSLKEGHKLLQSNNFIHAREYFLDLGDMEMVSQCNNIIRGKKLIDEVTQYSIESISDELKQEIIRINKLFMRYGISYAPLTSIMKVLNKN